MIWLAVILLVAAFFLIFLELVIPSFGTIALTSLACFTGAVVLAFMESVAAGFVFIGIVIVGVPVAVYSAVKLFRHSPLGKKMILGGPTQDLSGGGAGIGEDAVRVGARGVAHTKLRPSGIALIDGKRVDVVTVGVMLDAGEPVEVTELEGNRVVVKRIESNK